MQDGILVDNIYVGSSEKDAADFAALTFDVKKPIEEAAEKASKPKSEALDEEDDEDDGKDFSIPKFLANPAPYARTKVTKFIQRAAQDPVAAFKSQPQTGAVVGGFAATLIGMIGIRKCCILT